jgi:hypothetical protein
LRPTLLVGTATLTDCGMGGCVPLCVPDLGRSGTAMSGGGEVQWRRAPDREGDDADARGVLIAGGSVEWGMAGCFPQMSLIGMCSRCFLEPGDSPDGVTSDGRGCASEQAAEGRRICSGR